jgi:hypothetical protein
VKCSPIVLLQSILFFSCFGVAYAQVFDGIERFQLKISHNHKEINYGASESTIIQNFGTPVKNQLFEFETLDEIGKEIIYNDFNFLLLDNKTYAFRINSSSARLIYNGASIKISDSVSALSNFFQNYLNFPCENGKDGYCINLLYNGRYDEGFVLRVYYNKSTNKITEIFTHQN